MADYFIFGSSAVKFSTGQFTRLHVYFGIAHLNDPGWLSWYMFTENFDNANAEDAFQKVGLHPRQFTKTVIATSGDPGLFKYNNYIESDKFASMPGMKDTGSAACVMFDSGGKIGCLVTVTSLPKGPAMLAFNLKFPPDAGSNPKLDDYTLPRQGSILLTGAVPVSTNVLSAMNKGPTFTHRKGTNTPLY
jgi:hypothetical protein